MNVGDGVSKSSLPKLHNFGYGKTDCVSHLKKLLYVIVFEEFGNSINAIYSKFFRGEFPILGTHSLNFQIKL